MTGSDSLPFATTPLMDMVELPDGICLYCYIPGAAPENVHLTVTGTVLHLRAEVRLPRIRGKIHALEFSDTVYERKVPLPRSDLARLEATLSCGVLRVFIPFPLSGKQSIPVTGG